MIGTGHNRFYVYAEAAGRAHGHVIEAYSLEAAAVGYAELHSPPVNAGNEVRLFVAEMDGGREHCFVIDLDDGQAETCG